MRQQLLDMKATILDAVVGEVKAIILEVQSEEDDTSASYNRDDADGSEARSESSQRTDRRRVEGPSDDWAADLSSVTEELERTLVSPASSTPQFATLLVRAVGLLGCEDDLERFLLEEGCIHFESVIQKTREQVLAALAGQGLLHSPLRNLYILHFSLLHFLSLYFSFYFRFPLNFASLVITLFDCNRWRRCANKSRLRRIQKLQCVCWNAARKRHSSSEETTSRYAIAQSE